MLLLASLLVCIEFMIFSAYTAVIGVILLAAKEEYNVKILCFSGIYVIVIWLLMMFFNVY